MGAFGQTFLRLVIASVITAGVLALVVYFAARKISGEDAGMPAVAGVGVSLVAGILGALPVAFFIPRDPRETQTGILAATAIRLFAAMGLALAVMFLTKINRPAFGLAVGVSYLVMLAVDTIVAVQLVQRYQGGKA